MSKLKIGAKAIISPENDNECYDDYRDQVLIVEGIYSNIDEHRGYDEGMSPMKLVEFDTESGDHVPFALYEYEFEILD